MHEMYSLWHIILFTTFFKHFNLIAYNKQKCHAIQLTFIVITNEKGLCASYSLLWYNKQYTRGNQHTSRVQIFDHRNACNVFVTGDLVFKFKSIHLFFLLLACTHKGEHM